MTDEERLRLREQAKKQIKYAQDLDGFPGSQNVITWCGNAIEAFDDIEKLKKACAGFAGGKCAGDAEVKRLTTLADSEGAEVVRLKAELAEARQWINDLHAGMYINCVYCGHRYGPNTEVPASMADVLKQHVEQCPKHPMSKLKAELAEARQIMLCLQNVRHRDFDRLLCTGVPINTRIDAYLESHKEG